MWLCVEPPLRRGEETTAPAATAAAAARGGGGVATAPAQRRSESREAAEGWGREGRGGGESKWVGFVPGLGL